MMNLKAKIWNGDHYFLNLRFLLIVCVFLGNAIEPLIHRMPGLHALYIWIFIFHMPLFVFVTGYFAKSNLKGLPGKKIMAQIALQYLIFQSLYSLLDITVFKVDNIHHSFFAPYLLLWFLAAHIIWRCCALAMQKWTRTVQLVVSVLLGIAVGYAAVDGTWLSLSRTFVYLPFFIAGYHFRSEWIKVIYTPKIRTAAGFSSLFLFAAAYCWGDRLPLGWLYGNMTYSQLGSYTWYMGIERLGMYVLQLYSALAFLSFIPLFEGRLTDWGRRTLYVFLLHGLIVRFAAASPLYQYIHGFGGAASVITASVLLTVLLCQPFVRKISSGVIEPPVEWMFSVSRKARTSVEMRFSK